MELVINLADDEFRIYEPVTGTKRTFRGAIAAGCYTRAFEFDARAHADVLGVHFKPAGARLLGVPPGVLANTHVGLEDLWGSGANELRERLCAASSFQQRLDLLAQEFITRLPRHPDARPVVHAALSRLDARAVDIGNLAETLDLSRRRFIEVFTEDVGMTPKRYAMVRRFQRALALAVRRPRTPWAKIAVECGYYDQAHLCRDWAELTRLSPGAFLDLQSVPVKDNHVALP